MNNLQLRLLQATDISRISLAFTKIGWNKPESQYQRYLLEQEAKEREVLVAEVESVFAGYLTIKWNPEYAAFQEAGIPEIQDLNVLPFYRRQGVATRLMDEAEALISTRSTIAGLGVGLHPGYNAAQRMYALRGYAPDGQGLTYQNRYIQEGEQITLDDDLILHLTKPLQPLSVGKTL
jgi:GNAT superfamily N-acetyltransferase